MLFAAAAAAAKTKTINHKHKRAAQRRYLTSQRNNQRPEVDGGGGVADDCSDAD